MNISSGISQVIYQTQLPGKILLKRAYLWPEYHNGKVDKISPIHEKSNPEQNYIKRSSLDAMEKNLNTKTDISRYSSQGNLINTQNNYTPGSIFEAFA